MFSSVNENNVGFSAIGQEELETVNGGTSFPFLFLTVVLRRRK